MKPASSSSLTLHHNRCPKASPARTVTTYSRWGNGQHTVFSAMTALPSMPPLPQRTGEVLCGSVTAAMKNVWRQTVAYVEIAISKPTSFPAPCIGTTDAYNSKKTAVLAVKNQEVVLLTGLHVR